MEKDEAKLTVKLKIILAIVLLADTLDLMDSTITNIAAPTIASELGGGEHLIKWLGSSYSLALGILLVLGGRLGDKYGKKLTFLVGIAGFGMASLLCSISVDPTMLVISRLLQGCFGALMIPQGMSILMGNFSKAQFRTAVVFFGPVMGAASIVGPVVSGFIIKANIFNLGWRPLFLINIILTFVGFILGYRYVPKDNPNRNTVINNSGAVILGISMLGLIYGLINISDQANRGMGIAALLIGLIALAFFYINQTKAKYPLIMPSLFKNKGFTFGLLLGLGYFAVANGFSYVISLFFQINKGLDAQQTSIAMIPMILGILVASFVSRPLIDKVGKLVIYLGLTLTIVSIGIMLLIAALLQDKMGVLIVVLPLFILGLGMGSCFSSIYDIAIGDVNQEEVGSASGSLSAIQQLAAAIGSALVTTIYFSAQNNASAGSLHAFTVSLAAVLVVSVICLPIVRFLPNKTADMGL